MRRSRGTGRCASAAGGRPGKQPGAQSSTLQQVAEPGRDDGVRAGARAADAARTWPGAGVTGVQRLQVFDIAPPPPPKVTEYQVQARACERCGAVTAGQPPAGVTGRAQYGPEVHAQAANLATRAPPAGRPGRAADGRR